MRTKPTAVVFDLDNTLYEYSPADLAGRMAVYSYFKHRLGISPRLSKSAWDSAKEITKRMNTSQAAQHSRLVYAQHALRILGYEGHPTLALEIEELYWSEFLANMKIYPEAQETLTLFRFNKIPLVLVTDLTSQIQLRKLLRLRLERQFDIVVTSEMVGCEKVDLKPFRFALEGLSLSSRKHVWFIGDTMTDVNCSNQLIDDGVIESGHGLLLASEAPKVKMPASISQVRSIAHVREIYQEVMTLTPGCGDTLRK